MPHLGLDPSEACAIYNLDLTLRLNPLRQDEDELQGVNKEMEIDIPFHIISSMASFGTERSCSWGCSLCVCVHALYNFGMFWHRVRCRAFSHSNATWIRGMCVFVFLPRIGIVTTRGEAVGASSRGFGWRGGECERKRFCRVELGTHSHRNRHEEMRGMQRINGSSQ